MATNRNFDQSPSSSNRNYEPIQQELLRNNNDKLRFHFWAMTIYQSYYSCYMQHHPNAYDQRAKMFEQMFVDNTMENHYNNITFDQIRSYSARIACKYFPRTLMIQFINTAQNECPNSEKHSNLTVKIREENGKILAKHVQQCQFQSNDEPIKIDLPVSPLVIYLVSSTTQL